MSSCKRCAGGCRDFSSKADRAPNIASIDVVEGILLTAAKNMRARAEAFAAGELSEADIEAANRKLLDWLATTFAGENPHFETTEDWNPYGLAQLIREKAEEVDLSGLTDAAVVRAAASWFVADAVETVASTPDDASLEALAARWAAGFTGMPDF